jgi:predicted CoA-binding protein
VAIDVVDVFRRPQDTPAIAESAAAIRAKVLWMQLGIRNDEAATLAGLAGLRVIQDRCMKIEYGRLSGELAWSGINTRQISSRRRPTLG